MNEPMLGGYNFFLYIRQFQLSSYLLFASSSYYYSYFQLYYLLRISLKKSNVGFQYDWIFVTINIC